MLCFLLVIGYLLLIFSFLIYSFNKSQNEPQELLSEVYGAMDSLRNNLGVFLAALGLNLVIILNLTIVNWLSALMNEH